MINVCYFLQSAERSGHATAGTTEDKDLKMLVHQSQAGAIIGRAGFKIKELREVSLWWFDVKRSYHTVYRFVVGLCVCVHCILVGSVRLHIGVTARRIDRGF